MKTQMKQMKKLGALALTGFLLVSGCGQPSQSITPPDGANNTQARGLKLLPLGQLGSLQKKVSVTKFITVENGGKLELQFGNDKELKNALHHSGVLNSSKIRKQFKKYAPNSPKMLIAAITRAEKLNSRDLAQVLHSNSPLNMSVQMALVQNQHRLEDKHLFWVLRNELPLANCVIVDLLKETDLESDWLKSMLKASAPFNDAALAAINASPVLEEEDVEDIIKKHHKEIDKRSGLTINGSPAEVYVSLEFLPGGIDEDRDITITMDDDEILGDVYLTFGPHGIFFNKPALLCIEAFGLDLSGVNPEDIDVYYDNKESGQWELMQRQEIIVKPEEGYIKVLNAQLPHFSRYAIGAD